MAELPSFQESFDAFLASLGLAATFGVNDDSSFELPTASQTSINMLRPDLRAAYRLAYAYAKGTRAAAALPDWPALIAQEADNLTPEITAERMKLHFDAFFAGVPDPVKVDPGVSDPKPTLASPERPEGNGSSTCSTPCGSPSLTSSSTSPLSTSSSLPTCSSRTTRTPALSNAARLALRGGHRGISRAWAYLGLYRWEDGLSAEQPVTYEEIEEEKAAKKETDVGATTSASKYPNLRERWECKRCGRLRHEVVGHTTNLTKHTKTCDRSSET